MPSTTGQLHCWLQLQGQGASHCCGHQDTKDTLEEHPVQKKKTVKLLQASSFRSCPCSLVFKGS